MVKELATSKHVSAKAAENEFRGTPAMEQNVPNPAQKSTMVRYNISESAVNAYLKISDAYGKTVKQLALSGKGAGTVNIDCSMLTSGIYYYSIVADGKITDSKKMVVAR